MLEIIALFAFIGFAKIVIEYIIVLLPFVLGFIIFCVVVLLIPSPTKKAKELQKTKNEPAQIEAAPPYWTTTAPVVDLSETPYSLLAKDTHLLIAGQTGSGKSVLIAGLIYSIICKNTPNEAEFIFIDPKQTDLKKWRRLPHCIEYARSPEEIEHALKTAETIMMERFRALDSDDFADKTDLHPVYVIIEEFADLMLTNRKGTEKTISRLAALARAANVHLILATQRPTRDVITGLVAGQLTAKVALHCGSGQESRNILGVSGAEHLPIGTVLYTTPQRITDGIQPYQVPYIETDELKRVVDHWIKQI